MDCDKEHERESLIHEKRVQPSSRMEEHSKWFLALERPCQSSIHMPAGTQPARRIHVQAINWLT